MTNFFNLEIKLDFNFDFKKQFFSVLKTTLISRQLEFFSPVHNVLLVSSREVVNIILLNDSLEQFSCHASGVL